MQQKLFIGGVFVVMIILLGFIFLMVNEPSYTTLYSNLAMEDASKVVEHLEANKISYKLEKEGTTIKVPKDKIYSARLDLAAQGIPTSGVVGYEIFDQNTMGMSEFMQKINLKRALEGELSKTIIQQQGISSARVHIVFPERAIFKEDQKEPSASVVLQLASNTGLNQDNIMAIKHLVASSVEGLAPGRITIVDSKGKLLSEIEEEGSLTIRSGKQYEIKSKVESYLSGKAQKMLDNVLGYGNSIVEVNVDLDFKRIDRTAEIVDPESQTAISEQTVKQESGGTTISDSTASNSQNVVTNYEFSKTIERVIDDAGNIKRVTVAAVINGVTIRDTTNGQNITTVEPRSEEQLQKLEQIIRQAVGIDDTRNDQIQVVSIPFETDKYEEQIVEASPIDNIDEWSNLILILVSIGAALFILKSLLTRLKNEKIIVGTLGYQDQSFGDLQQRPPSALNENGVIDKSLLESKKQQLIDVGNFEDEISEVAQLKKMKKEKIVNYVTKNPNEAAKLINSWLREDEY
ncbi:MAG: flagellar M-ring protein FliF [Melioribacteraceae bacterium]|nr:flagellar M-ring protein FliF [Melioribacteraceae bacterium]